MNGAGETSSASKSDQSNGWQKMAGNASWVVATGLCFWFLCIHGPVALSTKDYIPPLLFVHLFGAYSVYAACVHNTFMTPSVARRPHVWIGRLGLALGVIGFATGFVLVWFIYDFREDLGFSIGITCGGIAQMHSEFMGYRAIKRFQETKSRIDAREYRNEEELLALHDDRDEQLKTHIGHMIGLFVLACGIPALIRISGIVGYWMLPVLILLECSLGYLMARTFFNKIKTARLAESHIAENTSINN